MQKSDVIIYGTGGLAELVAAFLEKESDYSVCGYCIENKYRNNLEHFNDLPLADFEKLEKTFPPEAYSLFIAIGNNYVRERLFTEARKKGYTMMSYITKSVNHWDDLQYGENVLISGLTGIQPLVKIGDNTFIIGSKIGHHSEIGNHVLLSCTTLGGNVKIGDYSFLGLNSAVQQGTTIAEKNIIGMGCNIERDTAGNEVYTNNNTPLKRSVSSDQIKAKYM